MVKRYENNADYKCQVIALLEAIHDKLCSVVHYCAEQTDVTKGMKSDVLAKLADINHSQRSAKPDWGDCRSTIDKITEGELNLALYVAPKSPTNKG